MRRNVKETLLVVTCDAIFACFYIYSLEEVVQPVVAAVELEKDGVGFLLQRKKEEEEKSAEIERKYWFLADFGPEFIPPQIIKFDSIYRLWKRAILSMLGKNFSPWFSWEASQPLAQSVHLELPNLAAQGCKLPEVATLSHSTEPFLTFSTRPDHSSG